MKFRTNPSTVTSTSRLSCRRQRISSATVHHRYGFLAENAAFVHRLEEEGITFIGPAAEVITLLGDKIEARAAMEAAGLYRQRQQ